MRSTLYITPLLTLLLVACQTVDRPNPVASKQALADSIAIAETGTLAPPPAILPEEVQRELASDSLLAGFTPAKRAERRFDVSAHEVDAKVFFPSLVQGTSLSVAVHPDVSGHISLSLKGVTLQETLLVVDDIYGYDVSREGRILRIYPAGMRTETFSLNYLYMQREGLSLTSVNSGRISDDNNSSSGGNSSDSGNSNSNNSSNSYSNSNSRNSSSEQTNGTFIRSKTKSDFWGELKETLVSIVGESGDGRQVVVTPQAGLVTIRAYPNEIRQVRNFIKTAESHLQRQVIIEAKILEDRKSTRLNSSH